MLFRSNPPIHLIVGIDAGGSNADMILRNGRSFFTSLANYFSIPQGGITHGVLSFDSGGRARIAVHRITHSSQIAPHFEIMESTYGKTNLDTALRDSIPGFLRLLYQGNMFGNRYPKVSTDRIICFVTCIFSHVLLVLFR